VAASPPAAVDEAARAFVGALAASGFVARYGVSSDASSTQASASADPFAREVTLVAGEPSSTGAQALTLSALGIDATVQVPGALRGKASGSHEGEGSSEQASLRVANRLESSLGVVSLAYSYVGEAETRVARTDDGTSQESVAFAFFGGAQTPRADMPTAGQATYSGAFMGKEVVVTRGAAFGGALDIAGDVTMTADFGAGLVNGRIADIRPRAPSATAGPSPYSIGFSGVIDGAQFYGDASLHEAGADQRLPGASQSGAMQGGFFGPKAAEAAGALAIKSVTGPTTTLVTGAFGAKKQ